MNEELFYEAWNYCKIKNENEKLKGIVRNYEQTFQMQDKLIYAGVNKISKKIYLKSKNF